MGLESDFLSMMASTISVKPLSSRDQYGAPTFATTVTGIPAHVTYRTRAVRTSVEDRVLSTASVQLPPPNYVYGAITVPLIHEGDEITLPDDSITRHVLVAAVVTDDHGDHHQSLSLT